MGRYDMREVMSGPAAGVTRSALHEEVATRLGVLPNFFCTAASAPGLIDRLWDFARSAYFNSPLPSLFKERLFVHLSRFCEVRYCIVRHVGFLVGKGYPAGDINCPPQSIPQVVAMLRRPVPTRAGFLEAAHRLAAEPATETMPEPETDREAALFDALSLIFLEPRRSLPARQAVGSALGEANLEILTAFLAFVRTAHFWTETHADLEFEPDMVALMEEHPDLADLLLVQSEAERTWSPMERAELLSALAEQREQLQANEQRLNALVVLRTAELKQVEEALRQSQLLSDLVEQRKQLEANEQRLDALVVARTAELMQVEEALRQSQKMEAIGQLTGGVAHDFNNLLTVIKSSTDLLKRPDLAEERRTRYVAAISDTVDRAAKLTGQLLAFARRQALKPEAFAVCDSVRALSDMMGTLTGSRIEIVTDLPDRTCFVHADPSQFDTALVNMAVNARDAMDGEGRLLIRVWPVETMPAMRSHPAVPGAFVAVSINDTGSGIPAERLESIFEPFFTTKGVGQGTGLGLSQVFGFAKQSGGEVTVESEVGRGTTFTLYLPRVSEAEKGSDTGEPESLMDGHGTCVLVVEDNAEVGTFAVQTLTDLGYVTVLAGNAAEALAELAKDADRFDVVFTDVVMPGMNGIDLAHEIRRQYYDLPVLLASGYSHVLAQNGTYGFELLHKPYSIENLSRLLRKVATWQRRKRSMGK